MESPAKIAEETVVSLEKSIGDALVSVILFGSAARGKEDPGDIDIMVVLKKESTKEAGKVEEACRKISMRHGKTVSPLVMSKGDFASWTRDFFPVAVSLLFGHVILFDAGGFSSRLVEKMEASLWKKGAIIDAKNLSWRIPA